jgi:tRNA(Ile2) C34 agmatinyltransferase TiaS
MQKIISNKIKCNYCGDVIESYTRHDFKFCNCGKVAVDGGRTYLRRCFTNSPKDYEDLSAVEHEEDDTDNKVSESSEDLC